MPSSSRSHRIALLTERYPPDIGGLAASVGRLATGLAAGGVRIDVFTITSDRAPGSVASTEARGVRVHRMGRHRKTEDTTADWLSLLEAEHRGDPFRLLHAYYVTTPGFVAAYAGRLLGVPSVVSARGNDLDRTVLDPGKAAHTLYALQHADAITGNSRELARKAEALAPGRRARVIPNGVDSGHFRSVAPDPGLAASLGLGDGPVISFVGEARVKKGLAHLLLAYAEVGGGHAAKLLLLGGVRKDDRATLEVFRAQNPDLPVIVVDNVDPAELPPYYALIDVLVLPSLRDGLPNALLEGMACERAIVATDAGGIPDALRHGENGHMVAIGDIAGLAEGMRTLLADAGLRTRYGAAARATILEHFTPEREIELTRALYDELESARR